MPIPTFPFPGQFPWVFGGAPSSGGATSGVNALVPTLSNLPDQGMGEDFSFLNGLDPRLGLIGGIPNLAQALVHRLTTPRGGLFYDLNYGCDVRRYLNASITPSIKHQLASEVEAECLKDERVDTCSAQVAFAPQISALGLTINVITAVGPFQFVIQVGSVTVQLLAITPLA